MAKVFIVCDSGHDYSKAVSRGELKFLFEGKINVFASDKLVQDVGARLEGAEANDYLLPSGNAMANCLAFTHLMNKFGKVNMLIFSFKNGIYEIRTIMKSQFKIKEA